MQRQVLEQLYDLCAPAAYHTALSVLRSPADAEDIAHETCLVVFNEAERGKTIENPKQYASTTAYRLALRELKRNRRSTVLDDTVAIPDQSNAALRATSLAWQACAAVSVAQRTALILTEVEEMPSEQVGRALGVSPASARQLVRSGREKMLKRCVELIAARREQPAECSARPTQIWASISGRLNETEAAELRVHLSDCVYCREVEDQLLYAKSLAAFVPLFPLDSLVSKKEPTLRLVAARRATKVRWWPWRRLALGAGVCLLLLLLGTASLPAITQRPNRPMHGGPQAATTLAAPATPIATLPPIPPTAFAYISRGEVWYRSSPTAAAMQLTNTGGHVDFFAWAPDGRSLVYKQTAGNTQVGDLHQIDLSGHEVWSEAVGAVGFSFSPDGQSWVAAVPVVGGPAPTGDRSGQPGIAGYRLLFGNAGAPSDSSREIDVPVYDTDGLGRHQPISSGSLVEPPPLIWSVMPRGLGAWWRRSTVHLEFGASDLGFDVDPATKAVGASAWMNPWEPDRAYYGPSQSAITLTSGPPPAVLVNGRPVNVVDWPGAVVLLSVSGDGQTALATYVETSGGHDVAIVRGDGSVTRLTDDGSSALGLFQPGSSP